MDDYLYNSIVLPNSCKHIGYIKNKAITQVLQLNHLDVIDNDRNQCYIPGCQNSDINLLKTFILMGNPPKKTYYSINYIGIGLYPLKTVNTDEWYTAYVPLNSSCFNNDLYYLKKCLLKIIGNSKLWLKERYKNLVKQSDDLNLHSIETTDSFQELNFTQDTFTQNVQEIANVFRFPFESKNGIETDEYIFTTPSCMYATKPELSTPFEFEELDVRLQILIQVKVRPYSYLVSQNSINLTEVFDSCFPNTEIEWYLKSEDDIVADRILFKIVPKIDKKDNENLKESQNLKENKITKVTLLSPNMNLGKQFSSDPGFVEIKDLYRLDNGQDCVIFDKDKNLIVKLKWTDKHNKVIYYLKSILTNKKLDWNSESKLWKVQGILLYEVVKFSIYLSLKIDFKVLYEVWKWLLDANVKSLPKNFDVNVFNKWMKDYPVYSFQRVILDFSNEQMMVDIVPYNKELINMFKEKNTIKNSYTWDKEKMMWKFTNVSELISDLISVIPNLRESNQIETELLESKGVFLTALKTETEKIKRTKEPEKYILQKRRKRIEPEDDTDLETKLIITVAGRDTHLLRLIEKIRNVVSKIAPPISSISNSGKIIMGGVGTGGIEFVEVPTDFETWNRVSMCIVPNEENNNIPIDKYDKNLMASLVGDVFIVKESAIDFLLENFKIWPSPHDSVNYTRWSYIINKSEPRCWGGVDFDGRQSLAQTGLFDNEDFYISGNNSDASYIRMLILLGCGNIVNDPKDAEYVIITDKESNEALELYKKFGDNDEDKISNTHGARHSTLVTPKYIYDCIIDWKLKRPTSTDGHMAFVQD